MSNTSYNFKDSLTIENNKYLKWLDATGTTRSSIIALDSADNVNINAAKGDMLINSNSSASSTFLNLGNGSNVIIASKLGVGFSSIDNVTATLTLPKNSYIGVNTTQGGNDGFLAITPSHVLDNTSGSRLVLYGADNTSGNSGKALLYAGNNTSGSIEMYTANDSLKFVVNNNGSAQFTPDGSTVTCNVGHEKTTFTNLVMLTNTTPSVNASTGCLQVAGGIGVLGNCYVDGTLSINSVTGNINFDSSQASTSYTSGAIYLSGGLGVSSTTDATSVTSGGALSIAGGFALGGSAFIGGKMTVLNSTPSSSAQTGSVVLYGGLAINNAIWSRSNSASQLKLAPATNGVETSISFFATNNFLSTATGGSSTWWVGQNVGSIGSGNFGIHNLQSGTSLFAGYNGYVGIATTSPSGQLDIKLGSDNVLVHDDDGFPTISSSSTIRLRPVGLELWGNSADPVYFDIRNTSGSIVTRFASDTSNSFIQSGSFGIGTSTPSASLHVVGDFLVNGSSIDFDNLYYDNSLRVGSWKFLSNHTTGFSYIQSGDINRTNSSFNPIRVTSLSASVPILEIHSTTPSFTSTTGTLIVYGGVSVNHTTDATSATSGGGATIAGGISVGKSMFIGGPILKIPSGNTVGRPTLANRGYIRYNTETDQFEGFGAGDNWGSLGGVIDVNQDTKILAENGAGNNDDNLRFFTFGVERMRINSVGNVGIGTTAPSQLFSVYNGRINVTHSTAAAVVELTSSTSTSYLFTSLNTRDLYINPPLQHDVILQSSENGVPGGGRVGIATNDPQSTLDINGTIQGNGTVTFIHESNTFGSLITSGAKVGIGSHPTVNLDIDVASENGSMRLVNSMPTSSFIEIGLAFGDGVYSTDAYGGDGVIKTAAGRNMLLQQGSGPASILIQASTGNVGVNNNNPSESLDVNGTARISGHAAFLGSVNTLGNIFTVGDGNVGINTTAPVSQLDVLTTNTFGNIFLGNNDIHRKLVLYSEDANEYQFSGVGTSSGNVTFHIPTTDKAYDFYAATSSTSSNHLVRFQGDGNIGIGTTNPLYKLDLQGSLRAQGPSNLSNSCNTVGCIFTTGGNVGINSTSPGSSLCIAGNGQGGTLKMTRTNLDDINKHVWLGFCQGPSTTDANDVARIALDTRSDGMGRLAFTTGAAGGQSEKMRIDENGYVGIGTSSPTAHLDVHGTVSVSQGLSTDSLVTSTVSSAALLCTQASAGSLNVSTMMSNTLLITSTTNATGIGSGGSLTVLGGASFSKDVFVGGTVTTSSDIRLKENIRSLSSQLDTSVLDTLDHIRTVKYSYIQDSDAQEHIGFIAQDFEKDYPELLRKPTDGFYTLDYTKVTVLLLQSIKELKEQVKQLTNKT